MLVVVGLIRIEIKIKKKVIGKIGGLFPFKEGQVQSGV